MNAKRYSIGHEWEQARLQDAVSSGKLRVHREVSWPKGMEPPEPEAPAERSPVPLTLALADGNYASAIRLALDALPVVVRIDRLIVVDRAGRPPGPPRADDHRREG